jgi:aerobic carbon-monoxide dehydrogenase small subunit
MSQAIETLQTIAVNLTVNGQEWKGELPVEEVLLETLRQRLGLTGTKRSCESEVCGACTVLVDGQPVSSCTYLSFEADGKEVTSIEGLAKGDRLDPLQEAFIRNVGAQCGYCTAGQLMMAKALLAEHPAPTRADLAHGMTNLCRCGAYPAIAASIMEAARVYREQAAGGAAASEA